MKGYTIAQVSAFVAAIGRATKRDRLQQIFDRRAAGYDKKTFKDYVKEITR